MLLSDSKTLEYAIDEPARILVLKSIQSRGLIPVVLSERRRCFELCLGKGASEKTIEELERQLLAASFDDVTSYSPGELFIDSDCVFYVTFDEDEGRRVRTGIVYDFKTSQPVSRFERFCADVRETIFKVIEDKSPDAEGTTWEARSIPFPQGLARFIVGQDEELIRVATFFEGGRERTRASSLIAEKAVRALLRNAQEARIEGYKSPLAGSDVTLLPPIEDLIDAGLMQREVRVSCRKTKHPLFDLPSPDALALITVSRAKCSLCATAVADEVVEEVFNPTNLGLELLEGGNWLRNLVYQYVRDMGVPEYEIAPGPRSEHGDSYLVANVSGEAFLFAIRDGVLSPSFVRRATSAVSETDARHLVVVVTGLIDDEARMRLYEYAWRRARDGADIEIAIIGKLDDLKTDLENALERVALRSLARDLFSLDASLGASANRFVLSIFKFWRKLSHERGSAGSDTHPLLAPKGKVRGVSPTFDVPAKPAAALSNVLLLSSGET